MTAGMRIGGIVEVNMIVTETGMDIADIVSMRERDCVSVSADTAGTLGIASPKEEGYVNANAGTGANQQSYKSCR